MVQVLVHRRNSVNGPCANIRSITGTSPPPKSIIIAKLLMQTFVQMPPEDLIYHKIFFCSSYCDMRMCRAVPTGLVFWRTFFLCTVDVAVCKH